MEEYIAEAVQLLYFIWARVGRYRRIAPRIVDTRAREIAAPLAIAYALQVGWIRETLSVDPSSGPTEYLLTERAINFIQR